MKRIASTAELEDLRKSLHVSKNGDKIRITICSGTGCNAYGCRAVAAAFEKEIAQNGLSEKVELKKTGCHGFCEKGPLVVIHPEDILYQRVKVDDVPKIISETVINGKIIDKLLYEDPATKQKIVRESDVPFYKQQTRIIFGSNGLIDPTSIYDYIGLGGYTALSKVLNEMKPEEVISEVKKAGLRGRGGGGFPAGVKWETCRRAKGEPKYVICNADEGDPGAYMDRSLLEGNPHSVLEGMIIGAYAIGSIEGYVYVRNEYPLAVEYITKAVKDAEQVGLLGDNILGKDFSFRVHINRGGGAFVCGESSALMTSIEGKPGEPRPKHIHMVEKGLWNKPSNLNNVETWANVPLIINKGAEWYASIGTEGSKGTKIFSLVGKINNTGLVEVPMGITLREIVQKIGGGVKGGKKFKAVQTGGPSGGCIPESLLDLPVDYDRLTEAGSMMGSGGMIVMDEETCMVDVAKYFIAFLKEESCGKCTPCRAGLIHMHRILTRITEGKGEEGDIDLLRHLAESIKDASLCQLGGTAPNPVLTTLRYFENEYEAHIRDKKCPAGVCVELIHYFIDPETCTGCGACAKRCPNEAISGEKKQPHRIDPAKCIKCGVCKETCKFEAVRVD